MNYDDWKLQVPPDGIPIMESEKCKCGARLYDDEKLCDDCLVELEELQTKNKPATNENNKQHSTSAS